jgi:hypothetical protein
MTTKTIFLIFIFLLFDLNQHIEIKQVDNNFHII